MVAAEVVELHADGVGLLEQLAQAQRRDLPALPDAVARVQRRVVADDAGAEAAEQLRHRARRRRHADQADGRAAELAADQHAVGAAHRHAAQQRQQRADHELGLGLRRWR